MESQDQLNSVGETTTTTVPETTFYILAWVFFALCLIACAIRSYIRFYCFGRLLIEDYLMLFALSIHGVAAILIQLYAQYGYQLQDFQQGDLSNFGPNSFNDFNKAFVADGISIILAVVGIGIVKLNFLLFFRRLGLNVPWYNIMWWVVLVFTVATVVVQIAIQDFGCFFGGANYIFANNCNTPASLRRIFINSVFSAVADAVSDLLILCLPVLIVWRSRISMKKKLALTFVFCLVFVTIAVTITRGSVFHQDLDSEGNITKQTQSITFTWFWIYLEFTVAFLVACIASFRAFFINRAEKSSALIQKEQQLQAARSEARRGWLAKMRHFHDSVLDTCKSFEGTSGSEADIAMRRLPNVPPGTMTVDFNDDTNWTKSRTEDGRSTISGARPVSARSFIPGPAAQPVIGAAS